MRRLREIPRRMLARTAVQLRVLAQGPEEFRVNK